MATRRQFFLWTLALVLAGPMLAQAAPPGPAAGSYNQDNAVIDGTVTAAHAPDAGATAYLLHGQAVPIPGAALSDALKGADRTAVADDKGFWSLGETYKGSYVVVVVSAHSPGQVWQTPLVLNGGEYHRALDHDF